MPYRIRVITTLGEFVSAERESRPDIALREIRIANSLSFDLAGGGTMLLGEGVLKNAVVIIEPVP